MSDKTKRFSVEELSAYERWELPAFSGGQAQKNKAGFKASGQQANKLPTAGELEQIRKSAYEEGFAQGKSDGLKEGREQGRLEGLETGKKEGLAQGKAEGQKQIDQSLAGLSALMTALADPITAQEQQITQAMANVAIAIARSVIHRELNLDSQMISELVGRILSTLPSIDSGIVIRVCAKDFEYVQQAVNNAKLGVKIETHPAIHPGGCQVISSTQLLDYTVEKRFQKAVQEMLLNAAQQSESVLGQESPSEIQEQSDYSTQILDEVAESFSEQSLQETPAKAGQTEQTEQEDKNSGDQDKQTPPPDEGED